MRALGRFGADRGFGIALHLAVERGFHQQRLIGFVSQILQLGQHPTGEVPHAGQARLWSKAHQARIGSRGFFGRDAALFHHHRDHRGSALSCGFGIGRWRKARRRLHQPGDDGGFFQGKPAGTVAIKFARCRIHAIGAAAEIDAV